MLHFSDFIDKKGRWAKKQLNVLRRVFEKQGVKVDDFTSHEDPYIFVPSDKGLSFEGVRIYKIGDQIAFRVQKEKHTHPYGRAYELNVEEMWEDLIGDDMNEERAGKRVMNAVAEEVQKFFEKSLKAEQELKSLAYEKKTRIINGTDFSNQIISSF